MSIRFAGAWAAGGMSGVNALVLAGLRVRSKRSVGVTHSSPIAVWRGGCASHEWTSVYARAGRSGRQPPHLGLPPRLYCPRNSRAWWANCVWYWKMPPCPASG